MTQQAWLCSPGSPGPHAGCDTQPASPVPRLLVKAGATDVAPFPSQEVTGARPTALTQAPTRPAASALRSAAPGRQGPHAACSGTSGAFRGRPRLRLRSPGILAGAPPGVSESGPAGAYCPGGSPRLSPLRGHRHEGENRAVHALTATCRRAAGARPRLRRKFLSVVPLT